MPTKHGVYVTDTTSAGSPNVKTSVNSVPFVMGCAYGGVAGTAPTTVLKISSFNEYVDTYDWSGTDYDTPDTDYSLEVAAYIHFRKYKNSPMIMRNMFTTADFAGGVSTVAASDFTAVVDDIDQCYTKYGIVPSFFSVPGYSSDSSLQTAMEGKIDYQDSHFKVACVFDGDETDTVSATVTTATGITTDNVVFCYPKYGGYYMSHTFIAAAVMATRENSDVPYYSPSNYNSNDIGNAIPFSIVAADKVISMDDAALLADAGVVTRVSRGVGGYQVWNSWLVSYGGSAGTADYLNDTYIPRMMANFIRTLTVQNLWENIDQPTNTNQVNSIVTKLNVIGGNLLGLGALVGYEVQFLEEDNTETDLAAGITNFRLVYLAPRENSDIEVALEVNTNYFSNLFN